MPVVVALLAVIGVAAAIAMGQQLGAQAGHLLWLPVALGVLAFAAVAVGAWHRRRMAEIHELRLVEIGRWRRIGLHAPWPKACRDCGQTVHDWKATRAHDNPETSPCMRLVLARDAAELAPAEGIPWSAVTEDATGAEPELPELPELPDAARPNRVPELPEVGEYESRARAFRASMAKVIRTGGGDDDDAGHDT
jgi:hypothetical protein